MSRVWDEVAGSRVMGLLQTVAWAVFNSRLHVVFGLVMFTSLWAASFGLRLPWAYYLMISLHAAGTFWTNLVTDRQEDAVNYPARGRVMRPDAQWTIPAIMLCFLSSFVLALQAGWRVVLLGALLSVVGLLYGLPIRLRQRRFRIKSIPWLKNIYSSLLWCLALLLTPYVYLDVPVDWELGFMIPAVFLFGFFVELLSDVRDVRGDAAAGVRTLPLTLGESASRWLLHGANLLTTLLVVAGILYGVLPPVFWVVLLHAGGAALFVQAFFRLRNRQLASHLYVLFATGVVTIALVLEQPRVILEVLRRVL